MYVGQSKVQRCDVIATDHLVIHDVIVVQLSGRGGRFAALHVTPSPVWVVSLFGSWLMALPERANASVTQASRLTV